MNVVIDFERLRKYLFVGLFLRRIKLSWLAERVESVGVSRHLKRVE
ncbi:hypothetical protein ACRW9N_13515 [Listeria aquatica]